MVMIYSLKKARLVIYLVRNRQSAQYQHYSSDIRRIPTYDAAFKYIFSDERIRNSFFHAFIPDVIIE